MNYAGYGKKNNLLQIVPDLPLRGGSLAPLKLLQISSQMDFNPKRKVPVT